MAIARLASAARHALTSSVARCRCWERELVEHVATFAAERDNPELESLCDDVLAGVANEQLVFDVIEGDAELALAVERGRNLGWRVRPEVV